MHRPWASSKMPSPHESSNLPVLSKTMYGCSARVKTWTLSFESTATAPTWPHTQPDGSSPQPRTSSYWRSPASTTIRSLIVVITYLSWISGRRAGVGGLHAHRAAWRIARHAINIDDERCANMAGIMLLLDLGREVEHALTYFRISFKMSSTFECEIGPRRRVTEHQRHVRILPERVGHPAVGMPHPDT